MIGFWAFINYLQHLSASGHSCTAITESTRSTVVYGGNCVQAWVVSVTHAGVAWIIGS